MEFGIAEASAIIAMLAALWAGHSAYRSARAAEKSLERAHLIPEVTLTKDSPWPGWHLIQITALNPGPATTVITAIQTPKRWKFWQDRAHFILHNELPRQIHRTLQHNNWTGLPSERKARTLEAAPPTDQGQYEVVDLNLPVPRSGSKPLHITLAIPANSPLPPYLCLHGHWADQRNQPRIMKVFV